METAKRFWRVATTSPWVRAGVLIVALAVGVVSIGRVPHASMLPALIGLLPWVFGKYVLCPLRWHALSVSGNTRFWHMRVYAESELFGLLSPAHTGADLWRLHNLHRTGMRRSAATAEVGLDRLVGAIGLSFFVVIAGATLPPQVLVAAGGGALVALVLALVFRRRRPKFLEERPLPPPGRLARGIALSLGYQLTIMCMLLGSVAAVGHSVSPLALLGVFGASQVAGIIPGVHGASPREGALVFGLHSLGVPVGAAIGAVALTAVLAWGPALLLGGGSMAVRRLLASRSASASVPVPAAA
ncbi:MAG: lysylphosphatidylglycerol synthase domain-containing protein [Actinomycetes bacterium]